MTGHVITQSNNLDRGRVTGGDTNVTGRYRYNDIFSMAWLSHIISAVVETGVPDALGDEPMSADDLAKPGGLHAPTLHRVLRALEANGIFERKKDGRYQHNDLSRQLRKDHPFSWAGMARMWGHDVTSLSWQQVGKNLKNGKSGIENATGKTLYDYLHEDLGAAQAFAGAMDSNSAHASGEIARVFPFNKYSSVTDLGGGIGTMLAMVLEAHPHLTGVNFEIEDLKSDSIAYINSRNLGDRCRVETGSFLESIPCETDLYMVKNSLWNWKDADCLRILKNVRDAIGSRSECRFVLIEYIINPANYEWTTVWDLQILNLPGGRARTESEYRALFAQARLVVEEVMTVEDETVIVAKPV